MNKYKWLRLREIDNPFNMRMKKGEFFLYGTKMIDQKNNKKIGERITYFEVLESKNKGKNIEYIQTFDVLEEDSLDEEKRN